MRNARLDETQAGIKIARRNINNLRYADDTSLMAVSEEERTKEPLGESERGERKSWLKAQHSENKDHGSQSHHFMGNRWGNSGNRWGNSGNSGYLLGLQNHCRWWLQPWNWKTLTPWKESYDQPRQLIKKQRHYFVNKDLSRQGYGLSSSHVWTVDCEESWALKNWCFWTVGLENTLESPLDCKEIQPVHPKGDQSWVFIGRTDVEAETPILWPPDVKSWFIWKDPDAGKDWGQEDRRWDGWMASPTWWTWVWVDSGSWWRTEKPGMLQSVGSQSQTRLSD